MLPAALSGASPQIYSHFTVCREYNVHSACSILSSLGISVFQAFLATKLSVSKHSFTEDSFLKYSNWPHIIVMHNDITC